jgi:hypothetical protein
LIAFGFQLLGLAAAGVRLQACGTGTTILTHASVNLELSPPAMVNPHLHHAHPLTAALAG